MQHAQSKKTRKGWDSSLGLTTPKPRTHPHSLLSPRSLPSSHPSSSCLLWKSPNVLQRTYHKVSNNDLNPLKKILHSQNGDQDKKKNTMRLDVNLKTSMTDFLSRQIKENQKWSFNSPSSYSEVHKLTKSQLYLYCLFLMMSFGYRFATSL